MKKRVLLGIGLLVMLCLAAGCSYGSAVTMFFVENSDTTSWQATYESFDGTKVKEMKLKQGQTRTFHISVTTEEGTLAFALLDQDGGEIYRQDNIPTSAFDVPLEKPGKYQLKFIGEGHKGGFSMVWGAEE